MITLYEDPGTYIEWGVMTVAPSGGSSVEVKLDAGDARLSARSLLRSLPATFRVQVMWREAVVGGWLSNVGGESFAVRREWSDGRVEYEQKDSRTAAERGIQMASGEYNVAVSLVSRPVEYSDWWVATEDNVDV